MSTPTRSRPSYTTAIATAAGVGALVAGGLVFLLSSQTAWPPVEANVPASPSIDSSQLDALDQRIRALEAIQTAASVDEPPERVPVTPADQSELAKLAQRLAKLETQLAQNANRSNAQVPRSPRTEASIAKRVQENQQRILDPRLAEREKLKAWGALRNLGEDAWTDAVVFEMIRIGRTSQDSAVRADVWRQADARAKSSALVPGLLQALASDSVADVREEAAETLENYTSDPAVVHALEQAKQSDQDEGVRRFAGRSLERRRRQP